MSFPSPPPSYFAIPNPYHGSQEGSDSSPSSQGSSTKDFISRFGSPASDYSQTSYGSDQEPKTSSLSSQLDFSPNPCQPSTGIGAIEISSLPGFTVRKAATFPVSNQQYEAPSAHEVAPSNNLRMRRTFPLQPPTLTRSSDVKEQFVNNLVDSAKILVEVIWPLAASPRHSLSLKTYIQEILKRTKTSFSTLQVALYYLLLIKEHVPPTDFTMEQTQDISSIKGLMCGRRMFLTAIILSSKYLQDKNFSSKAWSKITSLSVREINANELQFLASVGFKLHVPESKFNRWQNILIEYSKPMFTSQWRLAVERLTSDLDNLPPLILGTPALPPVINDFVQNPMMSPPSGSPALVAQEDIRAGAPVPAVKLDQTDEAGKAYCPIQKGAVKGLNAMLSAWNLCKESTSSRCLLDRRARPSPLSSRELPIPHTAAISSTIRTFSPTASTLISTPSSTYSGQTLSTFSTESSVTTPTKPLIVDAFTHSPDAIADSPETAVLTRKRHRQSFDYNSYYTPLTSKVECSPAATHARGLLRAAATPEEHYSPLVVRAGVSNSYNSQAGGMYNKGNGNACQRFSRFLGCSSQAENSKPFAKRVCSSLNSSSGNAKPARSEWWHNVEVR